MLSRLKKSHKFDLQSLPYRYLQHPSGKAPLHRIDNNCNEMHWPVDIINSCREHAFTPQEDLHKTVNLGIEDKTLQRPSKPTPALIPANPDGDLEYQTAKKRFPHIELKTDPFEAIEGPIERARRDAADTLDRSSQRCSPNRKEREI